MVILLLLIPANIWISAYLSRRGLKIAAVFHSILFCEMLIAAFALNGGAVRDYLAAHTHLGGFFRFLADLLGNYAPAFIAPFCALETVCYIFVALAFVALTEEVVESVSRFIKRTILQTFIYISRTFRVSSFPTRVEKLFRKNCVMRC